MRPPRRTLCSVAAVLTILQACSADRVVEDAVQTKGTPTSLAATALVRPSLCDRPGDDSVRDVICAQTPPPISGLLDLQTALGLQINSEVDGVMYHNHPVLLGHSTSLSARLVSPINPRALLVGGDLVVAFQRGAQRVEIAAKARDRERFNLYLFRFSQACNGATSGCTPTDLYAPRIEHNWQQLTVEDDEDLKNTPSDCRQCHQRGQADTVALMRELVSPWTHFFDALVPSTASPGVTGSDLMQDYVEAHGMESYGGIDVEKYPPIAPFALERFVTRLQPLIFDTRRIESERWPAVDGVYPDAPLPSATWERAYQAFKRGEQLALPYSEVRATDPEKQAQLTAAYRAFSQGETDELPDLSQIFPDDGRLRARIGLETEPGASAVDILIQACGPCHNDVLDQSLTRARFNINLTRVEPAELDLAMERIQRQTQETGVMPPPEARQLTPEARERLLEYLAGPARRSEPVPELVEASAYGMAMDAR